MASHPGMSLAESTKVAFPVADTCCLQGMACSAACKISSHQSSMQWSGCKGNEGRDLVISESSLIDSFRNTPPPCPSPQHSSRERMVHLCAMDLFLISPCFCSVTSLPAPSAVEVQHDSEIAVRAEAVRMAKRQHHAVDFLGTAAHIT